MKKDIHPDYVATTITCACGNVMEVGSTKTDIKIEICSKCHPFFTGEQKFVDTEGRVDKFIRKRNEAETESKKRKAVKEAKEKRKQAEKSQVRPTNLKELLEEEKSESKEDQSSKSQPETIKTATKQ